MAHPQRYVQGRSYGSCFTIQYGIVRTVPRQQLWPRFEVMIWLHVLQTILVFSLAVFTF